MSRSLEGLEVLSNLAYKMVYSELSFSL